MIRFNCDYSEGAHEKVLERLIATNREQTQGYGTDHYSVQAKELIRRLCGRMDADVHFLVGGTQANLTVISAGLRPYQGVIAADTGHINVHETGAIEACGHKILALPSSDGKITAGQVEACCKAHRDDGDREHTVQPKMVYISQSTELGTVYSKEELEEMSETCKRNGLFLFMDGARLGYRPSVRCILYWRNEGGRIVRGSRSHYRALFKGGLPLYDQTKGRDAGKRKASWTAVPRLAGGRLIYGDCPLCG